ncbi:MAG: OmpH family outer membrane protein [Candidatus Cryptobacteroides sp.]
MKRTISLIKAAVLGGVIAFAASACSNGSSSAATSSEQEQECTQGVIVYFNLDRVLAEYDMANELRSVVETKVNSINQEVTRRGNKLQKDINTFREKLNKGLLTQSVAETQNQKLMEQQSSFETYAAQKQQEILEEQQVMMNQIADAINTYVQEYNAEKQYAMIIATQGDILSTPVVAGDAKLDITDALLEGLNAAYIKSKSNKE